MQHIYMQSNEHFEVFTTVFSPQVNRARHRPRPDGNDKVVVTHKYKPHWPDELELAEGDVIQVLSKHEESRWFGRLPNGQQGHFPASYVLELSHDIHQRDESSGTIWGSRRRSSGQAGSVEVLRDCSGGRRPEAPRGGGGEEGPFLALSREAQTPATAHSSPSLLHRILSKHRRKSQCQGATNRAFEPD
ncbi:vexin [Chanos chanos]|uniref:Vexin n=1 Tax=Chanos chanos TaxID=29144 RepID=A0A6J2UUM6_CHACN|nr:vexin-like [Chanos chanos]